MGAGAHGRVAKVPSHLIQIAGPTVVAVETRARSALPFCFSGQPEVPSRRQGVQPAQECLSIVPTELLHRTVGVAAHGR